MASFFARRFGKRNVCYNLNYFMQVMVQALQIILMMIISTVAANRDPNSLLHEQAEMTWDIKLSGTWGPSPQGHF